MISINPVSPSEWDEFFRYINAQRLENGLHPTGYFIPIPRSESSSPYPKELSFRSGIDCPVGSQGWRRAFIARADRGHIAGHVDLRAHPTSHADHRCLLGMGVHRDHRGKGLGTTLLDFVERWAATHVGLDWIDLEVLSVNLAAIRLYTRAGFAKTGETPDMFRIDGLSIGYTMMSKRISRSSPGAEPLSPSA